MPPIAIEVLGIGPFWTGVLAAIVGVVLLIAAAIALVLISERLDESRWAGIGGGAFRPSPARGVVIIDWADPQVLATIAKQLQVQPEPVRLERGEAESTSTGVDSGTSWLRGKLVRDRRHDQRAFYELTSDPNHLLQQVLQKLADDGALTDDLDVAAAQGGVLHGELLDNIIQVAQNKPELDAAREAVLAVQASALSEAQRYRWREWAKQNRFALVENAWRVELVVDATTEPAERSFELHLTRLHEASSYQGNGLHLPDGLALVAQLGAGETTASGKARLQDGSLVRAGVLCTGASYDDDSSTLRVTPVVVFSRVEDGSFPPHPMGC